MTVPLPTRPSASVRADLKYDLHGDETPRTLRVLIVEDMPHDADLMVRELQRAGYAPEWECVEDEPAYLAALARPIDIILSDYTLPQFSALRALQLRDEQHITVPLIVVTGTVGEETAVACIKHGAADFLLKDRLVRLGIAVGQALEQQRLLAAEHLAERAAASAIAQDASADQRRQHAAARGEKLRAMGQMAGGVAHDLNQSLALILGYSELLLAALDVDAPGLTHLSEMTSVIARAASDGGETVKRLLTFARSEPDAPREQIDLGTLLAEVAHLTAPRWREMSNLEGRSITLTVEAEPALYVMGVAHLLREALINLVFNAVDALPDGGRIVLSASRTGATVVVRVTDNGIGISQEAQARMFEPYFTTKGERGSGLGLSLVYGIMEGHDGTIRVTSEPGHGTSLNLYFPSAAPQAAVIPAAALHVLSSRSLRILAVDDEPALVSLMERMLDALGHQASTAISAEHGLRMLADAPFDLVISDIGMGDGMNGWQFVEQIRQRFPLMPVVLATGWGAAIGGEEAARMGLSAVVSKPFRLADLKRALATITT
jgi:signal transduction histidine kinase